MTNTQACERDPNKRPERPGSTAMWPPLTTASVVMARRSVRDAVCEITPKWRWLAPYRERSGSNV